MAIYRPDSASQPYTSVEFLDQSEGNRAFFHLRKDESEAALRARLAELGQVVEERTNLDGGTILITHGPLHADALRKEIGAGREVGAASSFNAWKWRGAMGFSGQLIQLGGVLQRANNAAHNTRKDFIAQLTEKGMTIPAEKKPPLRLEFDDPNYFKFVAYNLGANTVAYTLGSAIYPDHHRTRKVKQRINERLLEEGGLSFGADTLPNPRALLLSRHKEATPLSAGNRFHGFMQRHSNWFETGLRLSGAYSFFAKGNYHETALAEVKAGQWREGIPKFFKYDPSTGISGKLAYISGALILPGKFLALASSTPDKYSGEKPGPIRWLRDTVFFRLGGVMETIGYGINTYGALTGRGQKNEQRNWWGFIGFGLFTMAYAVRWWAPVGKRKADMEEIYAHAVDAVARFPSSRQSAALARAAAVIIEEFGDQHLEYGKVHARLRAGLLEAHNIGVAVHATPDREPQVAQAPALSDREIDDLAGRLQHTGRQQKILDQLADKPGGGSLANGPVQKGGEAGFAASARPASRPTQGTSLLARAERGAAAPELAAV